MRFSTVIQKAKSYLPFLDEGKLMRAYNFAKKAHRGQKRIGGQLYVSHPVCVAEILTNFFADEDVLIAALFHDILEDTKYTIQDIENKFGKEVALLVDGVTKLDKAQYPQDKTTYKIESLKKFFRLSEKDLRVILIKLADRLHNMLTVKCLSPKRRTKLAIETQDIYIPITNLLGIWSIKNQLEDLCFECLKPAQYNKIKNEYHKYQEELKEINKRTIEIVNNALKKNGFHAEIIPREKSLFSYYQKLANNGNKNEIFRAFSFNIIVPKVKDCYTVLGILHALFKPKYGRIKDYIAIPKANNYRSLHTSVFGIKGIPTAFQIRTPQMHKIDEFGMLSNIHMFSAKNPQKARIIREKTKWLQKVLEIGDELPHHQNFLDNLKMDVFQNRIFTFTPKGNIIDLPEGAVALDFAYAVDTKIGHRAMKAEIDGVIVPIATRLRTGDAVKIITARTSCPRLEWLNIVKTADAKQKIKTYFKEESEEKRHEFGRKLLETELMHFQKVNMAKIPQAKIKCALERFGVNNLEELLTMIGQGDILPKEVINAIFSDEEVLREKTFFSHKKAPNALYPVKVIINYKDRTGLLRDIASTVSRFNVNIVQVSVKTPGDKSGNGQLEMLLEIKELNQLMDVFTAIEQIDNIVDVRKK